MLIPPLQFLRIKKKLRSNFYLFFCIDKIWLWLMIFSLTEIKINKSKLDFMDPLPQKFELFEIW